MSDSSQPLIFPIANYVGEAYNVKTKSTTYDLRGGWTIVSLSKEERDVWALAHGVPDEIRANRRWNRAALLEAAQLHVSERADQIIESLLGKSVLAEVAPNTPGAIEFAKQYRIVPLQLGLGNTAGEPWLWRIGSSEPIVAVSGSVYHIWEWCHLYESLWAACRSVAKIDESKTFTDLGGSNPEVILTEVLEAAHMLLSSGCAYFDIPHDWGTE